MTMISHVSDNLMAKTEKNHLLAKCGFCNRVMILVEGSVIFGNKWYHRDCFGHMDFATDNGSTLKKEHELQCDTKNNEVEQNGT